VAGLSNVRLIGKAARLPILSVTQQRVEVGSGVVSKLHGLERKLLCTNDLVTHKQEKVKRQEEKRRHFTTGVCSDNHS
jgi:hypothetical protein